MWKAKKSARFNLSTDFFRLNSLLKLGKVNNESVESWMKVITKKKQFTWSLNRLSTTPINKWHENDDKEIKTRNLLAYYFNVWERAIK